MDIITELKSLLYRWNKEYDNMDSTLQVGKYGDDDGTYQHGEMEKLYKCIEDLANVLSDFTE